MFQFVTDLHSPHLLTCRGTCSSVKMLKWYMIREGFGTRDLKAHALRGQL